SESSGIRSMPTPFPCTITMDPTFRSRSRPQYWTGVSKCGGFERAYRGGTVCRQTSGGRWQSRSNEDSVKQFRRFTLLLLAFAAATSVACAKRATVTTPVSKKIALSNGLGLSYVDQGDRTAPVLVLLPGLSDSWRSYQLVLAHVPASVR